MGFGFAWLALGLILSVVPYRAAGMESAQVGGLFLRYGVVSLVVGFLYTLAFLRNETETKFRDLGINILGGIGAALAVVGFLGGNINPSAFLLPYGLVLALLALPFL